MKHMSAVAVYHRGVRRQIASMCLSSATGRVLVLRGAARKEEQYRSSAPVRINLHAGRRRDGHAHGQVAVGAGRRLGRRPQAAAHIHVRRRDGARRSLRADVWQHLLQRLLL